MAGNNRPCPVCYSNNKRTIKHINNIVPNDFILPSEYDMVVCDSCGFVFNDVPDSKCYNDYYSQYKENTNFSIPSEPDYMQTKGKRESRYFTSVAFIKIMQISTSRLRYLMSDVLLAEF